MSIVEITRFTRRKRYGSVVTVAFVSWGSGRHEHHARLCCGDREQPVLMFLQPLDWKNAVLVEAYGCKLWVLVAALTEVS